MNNYLFLFSTVLMTLSMLSCDSDKDSVVEEDFAVANNRNLEENRHYLIRDFGDQFGVFEIESGEYIYCADCQNSMNLSKDIEFEGKVEFNHDGTIVYVYKNNRVPFFSISLGKVSNVIESNNNWNNFTNYSVGTIGYSYGNTNSSLLNGSNQWIPIDYNEFIAGLPLCQCVGNSSTPCTSSGGDQTDGCDVGGPGANGCGASSGAGMTATILGAGGGGSSSGGCSISCDSGSYACCDYTGG
ncbi:MAG: hypothetical protein V3V00_03205 [Saprospiraceae bacterium]